jgi:hypothetical protein
MRPLLLIVLLGTSCGRLGFGATSDAGDGGADVQLVDQRDADTDAASSGSASVAAYELTMDATSKTIAIAGVDPSRTMITCDVRTTSSDYSSVPACELTNGTTVTVKIGDILGTVIVRVQVIELAVGASVQRGTRVLGLVDTAVTIPISNAPLGSSFALVSRWGVQNSATADEEYGVAARLVDATTLELSRTVAAEDVHVSWQVVTIPGANVQSGLTRIANGTGSILVSASGIDPMQAFFVTSERVSSNLDLDDLVEVSAMSATQIRVSRLGTTTNADAAWFGVQIPGARVLQGDVSFGTGTMLTVPTFTTVDPARTGVFLSTSGGRAGENAELDKALATIEVTPTSLVIQRGVSVDVNGNIEWMLVEWPP